MQLYRLRLTPRSPWRTPWQADTLLGALCATAGRLYGPERLRTELIEPMLGGAPPFVISDALPGDWLPVPAAVRLGPLPRDADRKRFKRLRWMPRSAFLRWRSNPDSSFPWRQCLEDSDLFQVEQRRHNTLARDSDCSLEEGGLFGKQDVYLSRVKQACNQPATAVEDAGPGDSGLLTLYVRVRDARSADLFLDLIEALSWTGFGADVATGRGQFGLVGDLEPDEQLDASEDAGGCMVLSTFQPGSGDPVDGCWEAFPKFAKLGPDLGLANDNVAKHTLIMFRPGACFHGLARPFLGRALPMGLILPAAVADALAARGIEVIHPAFGLAIPIRECER